MSSLTGEADIVSQLDVKFTAQLIVRLHELNSLMGQLHLAESLSIKISQLL